MRILIVHSYYQQRGGEDAVFHAERDALLAASHEVETRAWDNAEFIKKPKWQQLLFLFWNWQAYAEIRAAIKQFKPHVIHVHNLFPFVSPSVLWAAKRENIPVVMTLHNYRLICSNGLFYRDGNPCEKCVSKFLPWPSTVYGCYRKSRIQTAFIALSMTLHRLLGSWKIPQRFIAPTAFVAEKLSSAIPENRIRIKPHFATEIMLTPTTKNGRVIFAGRLSEEKGIDWLLDAWRTLPSDIKLDIVGTGNHYITDDSRITFHGQLPLEKLRVLLAAASVVVIPSRCYETFSNIVVEAFAAGTAVIAPLGTAPASLIESGKTGALFPRDDVAAFHQLVESYVNDPERTVREGKNAHAVYLQKYQPQQNMEMLLEIYNSLSSR